jgi:hypothetical protein
MHAAGMLKKLTFFHRDNSEAWPKRVNPVALTPRGQESRNRRGNHPVTASLQAKYHGIRTATLPFAYDALVPYPYGERRQAW